MAHVTLDYAAIAQGTAKPATTPHSVRRTRNWAWHPTKLQPNKAGMITIYRMIQGEPFKVATLAAAKPRKLDNGWTPD